jgi:hypothetical protein
MLIEPANPVVKQKCERRAMRRLMLGAIGVLVLVMVAVATLWDSQQLQHADMSIPGLMRDRLVARAPTDRHVPVGAGLFRFRAALADTDGKCPRRIHRVVSALTGSEDALVNAIRADSSADQQFRNARRDADAGGEAARRDHC